MAPNPSVGKIIFALAWPLAFGLAMLVDPIAQDPQYYDFATSGWFLWNPHFWNVATNLGFLWVGCVGLQRTASLGIWKRALPETIFFLGILLTAAGSAYFHANPNMHNLVWDRLPMTMAFMAFYLVMVDRCFQIQVARRWLPFMVGVGLWSVLHWAQTEAVGAGDLRFYAVVQFLPLVLIPLMLLIWTPPQAKPIWCMLGFYVLAKICEHFDHEFATWLPLGFTGHAWKHLFAASGAACFLLVTPRKIQSSKPKC